MNKYLFLLGRTCVATVDVRRLPEYQNCMNCCMFKNLERALVQHSTVN